MAKIVYRQMPAPRELSQQILAQAQAKARMQKPQGGSKFFVQIPGGAWGGAIVIDETDTCISSATVQACQQHQRQTSFGLSSHPSYLLCIHPKSVMVIAIFTVKTGLKDIHCRQKLTIDFFQTLN